MQPGPHSTQIQILGKPRLLCTTSISNSDHGKSRDTLLVEISTTCVGVVPAFGKFMRHKESGCWVGIEGALVREFREARPINSILAAMELCRTSIFQEWN